MPTFFNILPMVKVDPLPEERDTGGLSPGTDKAFGAFEDMITSAMSPSSSQNVVSGQPNQQPQVTVQPVEIQAAHLPNVSDASNTAENLSSGLNPARLVNTGVLIAPKKTLLNFKTMAAPQAVKAAPGKNEKPSAPAQTAKTVINPTLETFANQVVAIPVLAASPVVPLNPIAAAGAPAPSQAGGAQPDLILLVVPPANPTAVVDLKMPTAQTGPVQSASLPAMKEMVSPIKGVGPNILPQAKVASTGATKVPISSSSEAPTTTLNQGPISEKLNLVTDKRAGEPVKNSGNTVSAEPAPGNLSTSGFSTVTAKPSLKETFSPVPATTQPQSDGGGTSIAKQDTSMKQAEKTNKIAGQTEKVLPGNGVSSMRANLSSVISANAQSYAGAVTANSSASSNINAVSESGMDSIPVTADTHMNPVERAQDMITVNAMRLSDSGNNSLQVVIKPDAGTQLSLELRQQGGEVQVQAVLQQGDFNQLSQQWPDLQQRLQEKGIQLAPLTDEGVSGNGSSDGNKTFENKQNQTTGVVPELTLGDAPAGMLAKETTQTPVHQGWETWA